MILRKLWGFIIWVFERADIIPPLIIVSAWHYQGALTAHDPPPVAIALGVLIDLGHYRAVKSYLNTFQGRRLIVLVVLTAMTGYFHWLWYQNVILAAAVPLLIICLALLSKWEGWERQAHVTVAKVTKPNNAEQQVAMLEEQVKALEQQVALLEQGQTTDEQPVATAVCCERCGNMFKNRHAYAAHACNKNGKAHLQPQSVQEAQQ